MNTKLSKLNKKELLKIISKMKKNDLINIINNKIGGGDNNIIKETKNAVRRSFSINDSINNNNLKKPYINNSMANDPQYNTIYKKNNNKIKS